MTINWIKCSERMPPDGLKLIVKRDSVKLPIDWADSKDFSDFYNTCLSANDWIWTPYTTEAWKELNKS